MAAWVLANLPAWVTGYEQWKVFWTFNATRGADLGSVWLSLADAGHAFSADAINLWSWVLFGAVCLAVAAARPRGPADPAARPARASWWWPAS